MNRSPVNYPNSGIPQVQGWPQNLMPPRFQGYPSGSNRSDTDAEMLLSSAVAWWDASQYREGDRFLRNLGTAGELLDARLGSSDRVATSNDPLFLPVKDEGYFYYSGSGSVSIPNNATLNVTTAIEMVGKTHHLGGGHYLFLGGASYATRTYGLYFTGTTLALYCRDSAGNNRDATATTSLPSYATSGPYWWKMTADPATAEVKFYTAPDELNEPSSWTQLGSTVTTSAFSGSTFATSTENYLFGSGSPHNMYRFIMRNGVGGTVLIDVNYTNLPASTTSFTESSTNGWTVVLSRATSGRKHVMMPSRWNGGRSCFLFGTDDYMEVTDSAQHQLLGFESTHSFSILWIGRMWETASSGRGLISKTRDHSTGVLGIQRWVMRHSGTAAVFLQAEDNNSNAYTTTSVNMVPTWGSASVFSIIADTRVFTPRINSTPAATTARLSGRIYNDANMYIGRASLGQPSPWHDFEFYAAAVFRRALTPAEIATIVRYYGAT